MAVTSDMTRTYCVQVTNKFKGAIVAVITDSKVINKHSFKLEDLDSSIMFAYLIRPFKFTSLLNRLVVLKSSSFLCYLDDNNLSSSETYMRFATDEEIRKIRDAILTGEARFESFGFSNSLNSILSI